jgi:hypothetical protein
MPQDVKKQRKRKRKRNTRSGVNADPQIERVVDELMESSRAKKKKKQTKRKKKIQSSKKKPKPPVEWIANPDLKRLLEELASSWRKAVRSNDKQTANTIVQLALTALPRRRGRGRVAEWLGPRFFDDVVPIKRGCRVRILTGKDDAGFRNAYSSTNLVLGTVNLVGADEAEVTVREKFGLHVVILDKDGEEQVLRLEQLKRCEFNPHTKRDDPSVSAQFHDWNRRQIQQGPKRIHVGTTIKYMCNNEWTAARVVRLIRGNNSRDITFTVPKKRLIHDQSVKLTEKKIKWIRKQNKLWGAGLRNPICTVTERKIVNPDTYKHLRDYIFSNEFLEPIKATEQATKRGHCFAMRCRIATTFPLYQENAKKKGIAPVSRRLYRWILSSKEFTNYRKDHCMCKTCLRSGWRGIWDKGRALLKKMDAKSCWPVTTKPDGKQHVHKPQLATRLKRVWNFLRLQLRLHYKEESSTAAHCLRMNLGSVGDPRLNEPCEHDHPDPTTRPELPPKETAKSTTCSEPGCTKRPSSHCRHCRVSFCRKHLEANLCRSEHLPPAKILGDDFVCPTCQPRVDAHKHTRDGCATCDEVQFFKEDLLLCAERTKCSELLGQAKLVCECIDTMVAHTARIVNQERFWPSELEEMRRMKQYDKVLLKSDYWKKFEGTALKVGLCQTNPKQSVETHSAWYLLPPKLSPGINWDIYPDGHEHVQAQSDGFRGFVVEFVNIISDVVVQDGYQSLLNLRTVLQLLAARHPRIRFCSRETDGAGSYNSTLVALLTLQLGTGGQAGTIKVVKHGHNEPGHGADICDTAGANCIRVCWRKTKRTGLSIICASRTTTALREGNMPGFIHLQVE